MHLPSLIRTLGRDLRERHGARVHKIALDAGFTCPNRDGTRGTGGCTFCNNGSFSPNGRKPRPVAEQLAAGRAVILRRTGARRYLAYFQAYTNTYADVASLRALYDAALSEPDVIGLSVGTRPDCVPAPVLDLLASYRDAGREVWLELGLQSTDDATLARVNRGHGFAEYRRAALAAQRRGLRLCTHLMVGLPGESPAASLANLQRVLDLGTDGLKLHPLHVVKGTALANDWRRGDYEPLALEDYVATAAALVEHTPPEVVYHRLTGTASPDILLAPAWCAQKWRVLNAIAERLIARGTCQGAALGRRLDGKAPPGLDQNDSCVAVDPTNGARQLAAPGNAEDCRGTGVTAADLRSLRGPYAAGMPHTSLQGCIHGVSEQGLRVGR